MPTKNSYYNYLKNYKKHNCKQGACSNISSMKKDELAVLARKHGYTMEKPVYVHKKEQKPSSKKPKAKPKPENPKPKPSSEPKPKPKPEENTFETLKNKSKKIKQELESLEKRIDTEKASMTLLEKIKDKQQEWLKVRRAMKAAKAANSK